MSRRTLTVFTRDNGKDTPGPFDFNPTEFDECSLDTSPSRNTSNHATRRKCGSNTHKGSAKPKIAHSSDTRTKQPTEAQTRTKKSTADEGERTSKRQRTGKEKAPSFRSSSCIVPPSRVATSHPPTSSPRTEDFSVGSAQNVVQSEMTECAAPRKNESDVWQRATRLPNGKGQCNACGAVLEVSNGNLSLRYHLNISCRRMQDHHFVFDKHTADDLLCRLVANRGLPLCFTEYEELDGLLSYLRPNYHPPSTETLVTTLLARRCDAMRGHPR